MTEYSNSKIPIRYTNEMLSRDLVDLFGSDAVLSVASTEYVILLGPKHISPCKNPTNESDLSIKLSVTKAEIGRSMSPHQYWHHPPQLIINWKSGTKYSSYVQDTASLQETIGLFYTSEEIINFQQNARHARLQQKVEKHECLLTEQRIAFNVKNAIRQLLDTTIVLPNDAEIQLKNMSDKWKKYMRTVACSELEAKK